MGCETPSHPVYESASVHTIKDRSIKSNRNKRKYPEVASVQLIEKYMTAADPKLTAYFMSS